MVIEPELLVMVLDFDMPAGLVIVDDLVVTFVAGACEVVILVVFDELALIVLVVPVLAGAVVWARAAEPPSRLRETRRPRMRFITGNVKGVRNGPSTALRALRLGSNVPIFLYSFTAVQRLAKRDSAAAFKPVRPGAIQPASFTPHPHPLS
ncbi:hypothetical protein GCM10027594_07020 [Hymenobacter agri]